LDQEIARVEQRRHKVCAQAPATELLMTLPGVGFMLAVVMGPEVGAVRRFARPQQWVRMRVRPHASIHCRPWPTMSLG
jgi:transposase